MREAGLVHAGGGQAHAGGGQAHAGGGIAFVPAIWQNSGDFCRNVISLPMSYE